MSLKCQETDRGMRVYKGGDNMMVKISSFLVILVVPAFNALCQTAYKHKFNKSYDAKMNAVEIAASQALQEQAKSKIMSNTNE